MQVIVTLKTPGRTIDRPGLFYACFFRDAGVAVLRPAITQAWAPDLARVPAAHIFPL
jgi:hypothetical protein